MKTPEEIKKGLECAVTEACKGSDACPYYNHEPGLCIGESRRNALAYIRELESDLMAWGDVADSPGSVEDMARENAQMEAEIERQREKIRVLELSLQAVNDGNAALQRENLMLEGRLPRWISVEERLPEIEKYFTSRTYKYSQELLVYDGGQILTAYYCHTTDQWHDSVYQDDIIKITHWMPLPEAPKEEHKE